MRAVRWSLLAQADLAGIDDYYHGLSAGFASRVGAQAIEAACFLARHPEAGQAVPGSPYRKWRVRKTPYILFYRPDGTTLRVVRLIHASRDWKNLL